MKQENRLISAFILAFFLCFATGGITVAHASQKTQERQLKHDKKYKKFTEKKLNDIRKYIAADSIVSARKGIKQAEKYVAKISAEFMASVEGKGLKTELDDLDKEVSARENKAAEASLNANALLQEKINYGPSVKQHATAYYLLNAGKNKSTGGYAYGFDDVTVLEEKLPLFIAYEMRFKKEFPNLIATTPTYSYEGIKVENLLDLIHNANEYRANFIEVVGNEALNAITGQAADAYDRLQQFQLIGQDWIDELYGKEAGNRYFDMDIKLKPYYDAVSRPLPKARLLKLAEYKPKLKETMERIARSQSWNAKTYSVQNGAMKKTATRFADRKGWKLVDYGTTDVETLHKNALGVPLYKSYEGMVVYRVANEPFDRAYRATFFNSFDGTGYTGISEIRLDSEATPFKR